MIKKTIQYTNFNGEEETEDFFFHLSKAELVELEASTPGGLSATLERIQQSDDGNAIIAEFKKIILMSYGQKSSNGKRFVKTKELREDFESSEAYSALFMSLITDEVAATEFMNGIIPADLTADMAKVTQREPKPEAKILTMTEAKALPMEEQAELTNKIISGEIQIIGE